jgi:putative dimethyl sulfoxide reductase chaperone
VKDVPEVSLGLLSRLWLREPDSLALAAARGLPSLAPHADEPAAMAPAYTDLFLLNVYPYGTAFIDPSGELNGPAAWLAARRYEDRGFRPPELFEVGAPDHVGLCLGFLEHLARGGQEDLEFSSFLLEWVPICCLAVEREPSAHPFYRAVAAATRRRLMEDIPESVSQTSEPEESAPQSTDPEEEEVGLSHIVRFLLAPARSGLFLSRARLGQLARTAGMRLPFGSRFDVARTLYQTAGEGGKVGTVLDLLAAELAVWEAAYRAWAEEHRRWAPLADRWLHRTGETGRMIGQMRKILENPPELEYTDGRSGEGFE